MLSGAPKVNIPATARTEILDAVVSVLRCREAPKGDALDHTRSKALLREVPPWAKAKQGIKFAGV